MSTESRRKGKENMRDVFSNEVLDDELTVQGTLTKELKGSIFTPKIIDGPRSRRTTLSNTTNVKAKPASPPPTNKTAGKKEKPVKEPVVKKDKPASKPTTTTNTKKEVKQEVEEDEFDYSQSRLNRPRLIPTAIAAQMDIDTEPANKPITQTVVAEKKTIKKDTIEVKTEKPTVVEPAPQPIIQTLPKAAPIRKSETVPYKAAYETMKEKFEKLNILRTTEAERLLDDYKRTFAAQKQSADQLISGLKAENERLKKQISETQSTRRESSVSVLSSTASSTSDRLTGLSRQVDLYRELTGLEMVEVQTGEDEDRMQWKCSLIGRSPNHPLNFTLSFSAANESFEYVPDIPAGSLLTSTLPAYLQEDISFGPEQLQLFYWRAMNFLMSQRDL